MNLNTEYENTVSQPKNDNTIHKNWALPDDAVVDTQTAARMLVRSPSTLKKWRAQRTGPAFIRGRPVTYRVGSLKTFNLSMEVSI